MAFPPLVLPIQRLAKRCTKWCAECDRRLVRLFEYCKYAASWTLHGELGTADLNRVELMVYADADLAGNFWDTKSTTGIWVELASGQRSWPVSWASKTQPATSSHTGGRDGVFVHRHQDRSSSAADLAV